MFLEENDFVSHVLKSMKNNKSPGSDGFTAEFYMFFWADLKNYITKAINQIFYVENCQCLRG